MATPYFGPGGQSMTLGKSDDKWAGVVAAEATIDSFKSKGSASTPVYFDANGVPQAVTSYGGKAATAGTADTAKACTGNAATATTAETAKACSGNSATATEATNAVGLSIVDGQICATYNA